LPSFRNTGDFRGHGSERFNYGRDRKPKKFVFLPSGLGEVEKEFYNGGTIDYN